PPPPVYLWWRTYRLLSWSIVFQEHSLMGEPHVISALSNKRAELAGIVIQLERQLDQQQADLAHLDATIRLFDPDIRPNRIRARQQRARSAWASSPCRWLMTANGSWFRRRSSVRSTGPGRRSRGSRPRGSSVGGGLVAWISTRAKDPLPQASSRSSVRAADGVGRSGVQHAVEHGHADGRFRALARQTTRTQAPADDGLVATHGRLDESASAVAALLLPAQPSVDCDRGNVLVPLRRVVRGDVAEHRCHMGRDGV